MTSPTHEHLGQLVQTRRRELKLGVEPAAKLAGISKDTWKRVEAGLKVWDRSYGGIEAALKWAPGSCSRILEGGTPIVAEASSAGDATIAVIPKDELKRHVGDSVNSAAIGIKGGLTDEQILELNDRVLKELRERGVL
jgi:DNA-binding XRE family transcriptional regulator